MKPVSCNINTRQNASINLLIHVICAQLYIPEVKFKIHQNIRLQ
jgi:hypothetical protein